MGSSTDTGSSAKTIANVHRLTTNFLLGYHGCRRDVAERVLAGAEFEPSQNDYDWLGPGIYFWQSNPKRAYQFGLEKRKRDGGNWEVAVVGAVIDPGLCLDLSTDAGIDHIRAAHQTLLELVAEGETQLPVNAGGSDLLLRKLDCAVIRTLHDIRESRRLEAIKTISGVFTEGGSVYPNSGFYEKTHIQICVCDPKQIRGVFRVANPLAEY